MKKLLVMLLMLSVIGLTLAGCGDDMPSDYVGTFHGVDINGSNMTISISEDNGNKYVSSIGWGFWGDGIGSTSGFALSKGSDTKHFTYTYKRTISLGRTQTVNVPFSR